MPEDRADTIRRLMLRMRSGDPHTLGRLIGKFYPELRGLVAARLRRECSDHAWQLSGRLQAMNPRMRRGLADAVFEDLSGDEIAPRPVPRDCNFARELITSEWRDQSTT